MPYLQYAVVFETVIAAAFVVYTLTRFMWYLFVRKPCFSYPDIYGTIKRKGRM